MTNVRCPPPPDKASECFSHRDSAPSAPSSSFSLNFYELFLKIGWAKSIEIFRECRLDVSRRSLQVAETELKRALSNEFSRHSHRRSVPRGRPAESWGDGSCSELDAHGNLILAEVELQTVLYSLRPSKAETKTGPIFSARIRPCPSFILSNAIQTQTNRCFRNIDCSNSVGIF